MTQGFIVTGTDTGIGKTVFSAALTAALDGCYWKPVQAGFEDGTDAQAVACLAALNADRILPEAYCLKTPCSPHLAAAIDGVEIDPNLLGLPESERPLIVEGAGGALVPLTRSLVYADMFNLPPADAPVPNPPVTGTIVFADNIDRLKLDVDRVMSIHSLVPDRLTSVADIKASLGRK